MLDARLPAMLDGAFPEYAKLGKPCCRNGGRSFPQARQRVGCEAQGERRVGSALVALSFGERFPMNEANRPRTDPAGFVVAALLVAAAAVMLWDAWRLQIAAAYGLGPQAMPVVVAAGLLLLALGNTVAAFRGAFPPREEADPKAIALILGGLVILIVLIASGAGFIPATALLFAFTAAAFGRRAFATDLLIGLVLATVVYVAFAKLLALSLPAGPIERLM